MKLFFVLTALCLFSFSSKSQNYYIVSGKVISTETGQALAGTSVFAQNTTIGTATDAEGNFKLYLPNGGYDLVVTYSGYTTESRRVSTGDEGNKSLLFQLKQKEKEMAEVSVVATTEVKDGWEKYGSFFIDEFIGKTGNSKTSRLKNPEALKFYFSKKRNRLKVLATETLQIENQALGYNIKYSLDSFTHEYATETSLYTGYPLFEEMTATDSMQKGNWMLAREQAYQGSMLHFMRSLYNRNLKDEGFEVQFLVKSNDRQIAVSLKDAYAALHYERDDSSKTVEILPNQTEVGIIFNKEKPAPAFLAANPEEPATFQFSVLSFKPQESIVIEENGYFYDQADLSISAYWTWDKMADLLPYDYHPANH
ncbi:MAG: hypothetical protein JWQ27_2612 [Ferruginibacter sp.]|nr:hypothetical protein [Ferruginibacter sp.]